MHPLRRRRLHLHLASMPRRLRSRAETRPDFSGGSAGDGGKWLTYSE